jgi:hypothetical protein
MDTVNLASQAFVEPTREQLNLLLSKAAQDGRVRRASYSGEAKALRCYRARDGHARARRN